MAIDTEDKRRSAASALNISTPPLPDADVDEGDRAQVSWLYRDFDFDEGPQTTSRGGAWLVLGLIDAPGLEPS